MKAEQHEHQRLPTAGFVAKLVVWKFLRVRPRIVEKSLKIGGYPGYQHRDTQDTPKSPLVHHGLSTFIRKMLDKPMINLWIWGYNFGAMDGQRGATIHVVALVSEASQRSDCTHWFKRCSCTKRLTKTYWENLRRFETIGVESLPSSSPLRQRCWH